jgi:hypothetical protein
MIDEIFVWESNNGVLTLEVPFGWYTPRRWGKKGDSQLTQWKRKHQQELDEMRNLSRK